jgi:hypothetical protein
MKKIFLLTLISVLFLSAFSQKNTITSEMIGKINITKYVDEDEISNAPFGWWLFFWREVRLEVNPSGITLYCLGRGWKMCIFTLTDWLKIRGVESIPIDKTFEDLISTYETEIASGNYQNAISKKLAIIDPNSNGRIDSYLIFQINWRHDPEKPYNGNAEISIFKTNSLGY